jgi:hypothetical protein
MADGTVNTGTFLCNVQFLMNALSERVFRQTTTLGDPVNIAAIQSVKGPNAPTASTDGAAVVLIRPDCGGSIGTDFSINEPSWPLVGSSFTSGGLYSSWALLTTVPANQNRNKVIADNMSGAPILCLCDDGSASSGLAPVNATGFVLNPKVGTGPEGGHYESTTFRGRLQFYGASSAQWVSARVE